MFKSSLESFSHWLIIGYIFIAFYEVGSQECAFASAVSNTPQKVCEIHQGEEWLVIQKRLTHSTSFKRGWIAYANGFGTNATDFWLGNIYTRQLTETTPYKLRVWLRRCDEGQDIINITSFQIKYSEFMLDLGSYTGPLLVNNHMRFTTKDRDQDNYPMYQCSKEWGGNGGWWFSSCGKINLNGDPSRNCGNQVDENSMVWQQESQGSVTPVGVRHSMMMIRPQQEPVCASSPCQHSSTCHEGSIYTCTCEPGYRGVHCETDIDECASSPCLYGDCVDGINGYMCHCVKGYTGVHCETRIYCERPTDMQENTTQVTKPLQDKYPESTVLEYMCHEGYERMSGDFQRECYHQTKMWLGQPLALRKCTEFYQPRNADKVSNRSIYHPNDTLRYLCHQGYEVTSGHLNRTCQTDGQFEGEVPTCSIIRCGPPLQVPGTQMNHTGDTYLSTVVYSCVDGTKLLDGDLVRVCMGDKMWNGTAPICHAISCPPPPEAANATVKVDDLALGSEARYTCREGYTQLAAGYKVCTQEETWAGQNIVCEEILCGFPPDVSNASLVNGAAPPFLSGETVLYQCKEGWYHHSGVLESECKLGNWTEVDLVCQEYSCDFNPPGIEGSTGTMVKGNLTHLGSSVSYSCLPGYITLGTAPFSNCTEDGWTEPDVICVQPECGDPPYISNATVNYKSTVPGSTATYRCETGFGSLFNPDMISCNDSGKWTQAVINCSEEIKCQQPETFLHSQLSVSLETSYKVGSVVEYECLPGYRLVGHNITTCYPTGDWFGHVDCQEILCSELNISSPYLWASASGRSVNSTVHFTCADGYRLSQHNKLVCGIGGSWHGKIPNCTEILCSLPPKITNAEVEYSSVQIGSLASYRCDDGHTLGDQDDDSILCQQDGTWTQPPMCEEIICSALPSIVPHLSMSVHGVSYGSVLNFSCAPGYVLKGGGKQSLCDLNGLWNGSVPYCEAITCGPPPTLPNVTLNVKDRVFMSEAHYACLPGFEVMSGNSEKICGIDGHWIGDDLMCHNIVDPAKLEVIIFVPEPTEEEKEEIRTGFLRSDRRVSAISVGSVCGITFVLSVVIFLLVLDATSMYQNKITREKQRQRKKKLRKVRDKSQGEDEEQSVILS